MKAVCENILHKMFADMKSICSFVVPNRLKLSSSAKYISQSADKADFLRRFYFGSFGRFGDFQRRSASFYIYIIQICSMPNRPNLKATAPGASTSRVSSAKVSDSHSSAIQLIDKALTRASKSRVKVKRYYLTTILACKPGISPSNLNYTHPFLAISREEAIGMACDHMRCRFSKYLISSEDIACYPLNLKAL